MVPDRLKPIIGVSNALSLGLTSFHCPIFNDWQTNSDLNIDSIHHSSDNANIVNSTPREFSMGTIHNGMVNQDSIQDSQDSTDTFKVNSKVKGFTLGPSFDSMKQTITNHPKYAHLFSGVGCFKCKPVHITMRQGSMPIQKPPRRVPIAMKDKFKQELDSMEAQGIISKPRMAEFICNCQET